MIFQPFPWKIILDWYEQNGRHHLPWRNNFDADRKTIAYQVWLSETMLQQTQVSRVIGYYEKILDRFPDIKTLAKSSFDEFFPYYKGLGYYSRAQNMLKTAKIVETEHEGIFPNNTSILKSLPGIGTYTARAIQAFAYDEPVIAFDTNIKKIFARYYFGDKKTPIPGELQEFLENSFAMTGFSGRKINAALMDFASLISTKAGFIDWDTYLFKTCEYYKTRGEKENIEGKKSISFPKKEARIIVVLHENHKKYFAVNRQNYCPFTLAPAGTNDIRKSIQSHFLLSYNLELSVRPVHDHFFKNQIPYIVCNAQIQTGNNIFVEYTKNDLNMFWKEFLK